MTLLESRELSGSDLISALHLSQRAPAILGRESTSKTTTFPWSSSSDTAEEYARIEQLFLACIRTGDDQSAKLCLDRLSHRFGHSNERVMGLRGLYQEATAEDNAALEKCLEEYEKILSEDPVNVVCSGPSAAAKPQQLIPSQPIIKRRVALLRSLNRPADAISALIQLLDAVPTDAEAWCELADLYQAQGLGSQAVYSLEEALLIAPNSWNVCLRLLLCFFGISIDFVQIHARLGELLYACSSASDGDAPRLAGKSVQHFCRSIELCDDYLRGFYGLVLVRLTSSSPPLSQGWC